MTATSSNPARECQPGTASLWQTIDSAPHQERVLLGWYQNDNTWFCETGMASHGFPRNKLGISNMSRHGFATHWQPLPEPPK